VTLVPQQKNGYDCGLFVCRYAYNEHFRFNQEVINQFRIQLKQLLQNLSDVYRYGTLKKARKSKSRKLGILKKPRQSKTRKNRQSTAAEKKNKSIALTISYEAAVDDEQMHNNDATRSDDAAVDNDQRIALTISDEAAVDDEQMHNNEATRSDDAAVDDDQRIALTIIDEAALDDEQMHNNDANKYNQK